MSTHSDEQHVCAECERAYELCTSDTEDECEGLCGMCTRLHLELSKEIQTEDF